MSPTFGFDYSYDFNDQERSLQRIYQVSFLNGSTLTSPLEKYNFSTGFLWDYWIIYDVSKLLKDLEKDPSTEAVWLGQLR